MLKKDEAELMCARSGVSMSTLTAAYRGCRCTTSTLDRIRYAARELCIELPPEPKPGETFTQRYGKRPYSISVDQETWEALGQMAEEMGVKKSDILHKVVTDLWKGDK